MVIYSCHLPFPTSFSLFHSLPLSSVFPPSEMSQGDGSGHSGRDLQTTEPNGYFAVPTGTLQEYGTQFARPSFLKDFFPFVSVTPKSSFYWLALSWTLNIGALFLYLFSPLVVPSHNSSTIFNRAAVWHPQREVFPCHPT